MTWVPEALAALIPRLNNNWRMLTLVATPIGNLQDITLRSLESLREADIIACEDTRTTRVLLQKHNITGRLVSFHAYNEANSANGLVQLMLAGQSVALVTDAGTPGIADPGYSLVKLALENGIECSMTPGPCALVMALALSGLPSHSFTFRGFPPRKSAARKKFFAVDRFSEHTLIFYESPHRIVKSLQDALEVYGNRNAAIGNDLTKKFEKIERGTLNDLTTSVSSKTPKGEYVLLIAGNATSSISVDEECDELN